MISKTSPCCETRLKPQPVRVKRQDLSFDRGHQWSQNFVQHQAPQAIVEEAETVACRLVEYVRVVLGKKRHIMYAGFSEAT